MRKFFIVAISLLLSTALFFASAQMNDDMGAEVDADTLAVAEHDELGAYLVDDAGRTLYVVVDGDASVPCEGECADAWPPYILDGMGQESMDGGDMNGDDMNGDDMNDGEMNGGEEAMSGGADVDPSLIGTTEREDGSMQVTYDGHPLYYFVNDVEPGEVNCQAVAQFGGTWYVLAPDGEIVRTAP